MVDLAKKIAEEVLRHKKAYYGGKPLIADEDYDALEEKLRHLNPEHPVLKMVGAQLPKGIKKVKHQVPMLSLGKTYDLKELLAWQKNHDLVGTIKVDGNSLSLIYHGGLLLQGKTRGNGVEGEDVTDKVLWLSGLPLTLPNPIDAEVRGEVFCRESDFVKLCAEMASRGLEKPTSPRNIVAGILGRKEHLDLMKHCHFFAFDLIVPTVKMSTEWEKLQLLQKLGFEIPFPELLRGEEQVKSFLSKVQEKMSEDEFGIDGAVFTYNNLDVHEELGTTAHHPRYKMSYKWQGQTATAKINHIEWATSRHGIVTPVARIEPVYLSGANITHITLHNAAHVKLYNLKPGDQIELVRSGEVIPKFLRVIQSVPGNTELPSHCPSCQSELQFDEVRLICPNSLDCPAQRLGYILNWINCVGIDDLSEKRLNQLMELNLVKDIPDIYRLTKDDLLKVPLTKDKMATKLLQHINESKSLPLARFLYGLGIKGAGLTTWESITEHYPTLTEILLLTAEKLIKLEGFAAKSAEQIVSGLEKCKHLIDALTKAGITPQDFTQKKGNKPFSGKTLVITGTLSRPRAEIEQMIKLAGGKVSSSVSQQTFAVVTNDSDSASTKAKKAKELQIPIWTEDQLSEQLR